MPFPSLPQLPSLPNLAQLRQQLAQASQQAQEAQQDPQDPQASAPRLPVGALAAPSAPDSLDSTAAALSEQKQRVLSGITRFRLPGVASIGGGMMQGLIAQGLARASEQEVATMCELMEALARYWRTGDPADEALAADAEARLFAKKAR